MRTIFSPLLTGKGGELLVPWRKFEMILIKCICESPGDIRSIFSGELLTFVRELPIRENRYRFTVNRGYPDLRA
jgi:hypothetical protein